jgi:hypothetical protein
MEAKRQRDQAMQRKVYILWRKEIELYSEEKELS